MYKYQNNSSITSKKKKKTMDDTSFQSMAVFVLGPFHLFGVWPFHPMAVMVVWPLRLASDVRLRCSDYWKTGVKL